MTLQQTPYKLTDAQIRSIAQLGFGSWNLLMDQQVTGSFTRQSMTKL